jgi:hypothetical protein
VVLGRGRAPAARPKLRVTVSPRRAVVRKLTTFRFRVRDARGRGVRGAKIRFAGRRLKTDRRGRASVRMKLFQGAKRYPVAAVKGRARGRAVVVGVRRPAS